MKIKCNKIIEDNLITISKEFRGNKIEITMVVEAVASWVYLVAAPLKNRRKTENNSNRIVTIIIMVLLIEDKVIMERETSSI